MLNFREDCRPRPRAWARESNCLGANLASHVTMGYLCNHLCLSFLTFKIKIKVEAIKRVVNKDERKAHTAVIAFEWLSDSRGGTRL